MLREQLAQIQRNVLTKNPQAEEMLTKILRDCPPEHCIYLYITLVAGFDGWWLVMECMMMMAPQEHQGPLNQFNFQAKQAEADIKACQGDAACERLVTQKTLQSVLAHISEVAGPEGKAALDKLGLDELSKLFEHEEL